MMPAPDPITLKLLACDAMEHASVMVEAATTVVILSELLDVIAGESLETQARVLPFVKDRLAEAHQKIQAQLAMSGRS